MSGDADRVHEATPARLEQARRDGQVPRSPELAGAVHMLGTILVAFLFVGGIATAIKTWTHNFWSDAYLQNRSAGSVTSAESVTDDLQATVMMFVGLMAPILLLMMAASLLGHWGQTGTILRPKNLSPSENISGPAKWWNRLFSARSITLPLLGVPRMLIAFAVATAGCWMQSEEILLLSSQPVELMSQNLGGIVVTIALQVAAAMLVLSLIDYGIERWSFARRMRMTDQQLRDELRMQNGDPATSNRRREAHREISRSRVV
ncbi:MAG: EscU/YscU/HrcU family type III secretion system export apparatus switch protein [Planctomycetota bacterium]